MNSVRRKVETEQTLQACRTQGVNKGATLTAFCLQIILHWWLTVRKVYESE